VVAACNAVESSAGDNDAELAALRGEVAEMRVETSVV
jgi:hypothetical protein